MQARHLKWIAVIAALAAASAMMCAPAHAADGDTVTDDTVTLELRDVDVKTALEALFRGRGHSYSLSPDAQGIIIPTLLFEDVSFDVALKHLLNSAGLVRRIQDGIYQISKKPEVSSYAAQPPTAVTTEVAVDTTTISESTIEKIPLLNTGASEVLAIMSGNAQSG